MWTAGSLRMRRTVAANGPVTLKSSVVDPGSSTLPRCTVELLMLVPRWAALSAVVSTRSTAVPTSSHRRVSRPRTLTAMPRTSAGPSPTFCTR